MCDIFENNETVWSSSIRMILQIIMWISGMCCLTVFDVCWEGYNLLRSQNSDRYADREFDAPDTRYWILKLFYCVEYDYEGFQEVSGKC